MEPEREDVLRVTPRVTIPLAEVTVRVSRSGGPGGQHANKTESRVETSFDVLASTVLTDAQKHRLVARLGPVVRAVAQDERSQARNKALALDRLRERLAEGLRVQPPRVATRPTAAARERRLVDKRRRGATKRGRGTRPDDEG
jgi:ribosome-associated protein